MAKVQSLKKLGGLSFEIDTLDVEEAITSLAVEAMPQILSNTARRTAQRARDVLGGAFSDAINALNYDQFPPEFEDKILENLKKIPITVTVSPSSAEVFLDLEHLGTKKDLERAFHRHALLETGHHLTEPYAGQRLYTDDVKVRHDFFESMLKGEVFTADDGREIPTAGLWERTKKEYLEIWGDKSPQWLYLQYGQTRFKPKIKPSRVVENFTEQFAQVAELTFQEEVDLAVKLANQESFGIKRDIRGNLHAPAGEITNIRGTPYKGGRFIPQGRR